MKQLRILLPILAALLVACGGSMDGRYLDAELARPLELPPDLSQPDTPSNFDLPNTIDGAGAPGKVPVLAQVDSVQLQGSYDFYWLSVEVPVEKAYRLTRNFWAAEGYRLVKDEPVIGIMQTEWIYREAGGEERADSWWQNFLDSFSESEDLAATQDQFVARVERSESGSRIYISHRGTEQIPEIKFLKGADETKGAEVEEPEGAWQFRRSDPALEVEMLSRLMIYLGLPQDAVAAQLARARLFKPRARLELDSDENSPYLILKDPYQIAWNRVRHALEVMNFDIVTSDFNSGPSGGGVFVVKARVVESDGNRGLFSLLASEELKIRNFRLVLTEETHDLTRLIIEDQKGSLDTSPAGAEFASLLLEQVK